MFEKDKGLLTESGFVQILWNEGEIQHGEIEREISNYGWEEERGSLPDGLGSSVRDSYWRKSERRSRRWTATTDRQSRFRKVNFDVCSSSWSIRSFFTTECRSLVNSIADLSLWHCSIISLNCLSSINMPQMKSIISIVSTIKPPSVDSHCFTRNLFHWIHLDKFSFSSISISSLAWGEQREPRAAFDLRSSPSQIWYRNRWERSPSRSSLSCSDLSNSVRCSFVCLRYWRNRRDSHSSDWFESTRPPGRTLRIVASTQSLRLESLSNVDHDWNGFNEEANDQRCSPSRTSRQTLGERRTEAKRFVTPSLFASRTALMDDRPYDMSRIWQKRQMVSCLMRIMASDRQFLTLFLSK